MTQNFLLKDMNIKMKRTHTRQYRFGSVVELSFDSPGGKPEEEATKENSMRESVTPSHTARAHIQL